MLVTDHVITVPLDHDRPDGPTIQVYAREIAAADGRDRPYLAYLQGGLLELDVDSAAFRHDLAAMLPFDARNPLYAVLHESSYADGGATRWSADRVQPEARQFSEQTADLLPGMHRRLTDEYLHSGLRTDGGRVLDRLISLARG